MNNNFNSFTLSANKKMLIGVITDKKMFVLKQKIQTIWCLYRKKLNKNPFALGKQ